jgi:Conjugative transposon protein TraO
MKYTLCFFISFLCVFPLFLNGQTHLKNQRFVELGYGTFDSFKTSNYALFASIGKYNKKINANSFEVIYAKKMAFLQNGNLAQYSNAVPVQHFIVSYKRDLNLLRNFNNTLNLGVFGKVNLGYESINKNSTYLNEFTLNNRSDYILGIGFGPELQLFGFSTGVVANLNLISKYQKFSALPFIKYRIHL